MESFLIAVVAMAVVLGVMILVHEFGHYAAAKWFGVRVDVFSIGFGKRLAGFRRGDTDYRKGLLPEAHLLECALSAESTARKKGGDHMARFDPLADNIEYGRSLLPLTRRLIVERSAARAA